MQCGGHGNPKQRQEKPKKIVEGREPAGIACVCPSGTRTTSDKILSRVCFSDFSQDVALKAKRVIEECGPIGLI
jgi:hypothetical protein